MLVKVSSIKAVNDVQALGNMERELKFSRSYSHKAIELRDKKLQLVRDRIHQLTHAN